MAENMFVVVHYTGKIEQSVDGATFCSENPIGVFVESGMSIENLHTRILKKLDLYGKKKISQLTLRMPTAIGQGFARFCCFPIQNDDEVQVLFQSQARFPEIRVMELFATLSDIAISLGDVRASCSKRPGEGSSGANPVAQSPEFVASPSFAVNLNQEDQDGGVGQGDKDQTLKPVSQPFHGFADFMEVRDIPECAFSDDNEEAEPQKIPTDSDEDVGSTSRIQSQPSTSSQVHESGSNLNKGNEFEVGQRFQSKKDAMLAIKSYSIRQVANYKVFESDNLKYVGKCTQFGRGCNWLIRVARRQRKGYWEVRKYNGPHTCLASEVNNNHRHLDHNVICASIFSMVEADSTVSIKILQSSVEDTYGVKPSYRKVWLAKQKAISMIHGDWEESYNQLPRWLMGVQMAFPGTYVKLLTSLIKVGDIIDPSTVHFHRVFWTFPPCVEAFKYCKPFVSIDSTHLYGKYGGTLLIAIAQDGNSNTIPIAFAVVESENNESWKFFMTNLRQHVTPQQEILVISNGHNGLCAAMNAEDSGWVSPTVNHAFCVRHVAANFALSFKSKDARKALVNAAYAKTECEYLYYIHHMRMEDPAMVDWVNRIEIEKWTQHKDNGRRYGHMTTNILECTDTILKGTRNLPITSLVKSTYHRLGELFVLKEQEAATQISAGQEFCEYLVKAIEKNGEPDQRMTVTLWDQASYEFSVSELAPMRENVLSSYRVSLSKLQCDCGYFQALHFPCRHALAACREYRINWANYVDDVYRMRRVLNVYKMPFAPPMDGDFLPPYEGARVIPDPHMRRVSEGRPKTGICNNMDEVQHNRPKRCGFCKQAGHTKRQCPQGPAPRSQGGSNT